MSDKNSIDQNKEGFIGNTTIPQQPDTAQVNDENNEFVQTSTKVIEDYVDLSSNQLDALDTLADLIEDAESIPSLDDGLHVIGPVLGKQVIQYYTQKLKPLKTTFNSETSGQDEISFVNKAMSKIMDDGGFHKLMNEKGFQKMVKYGDFFVLVQQDQITKLPKYVPVPIKSVSFEPNATSIDGKDGGKAKRISIKLKYQWDLIKNEFPTIFEKGTGGEIDPDGREDHNKTKAQEGDEKSREIDIVYAYDISDEKEPVYIEYGGSEKTLETTQIGKDFPSWDKELGVKRPVIPLAQFSFNITEEGILNIGVLHMVYGIVRIYSQLINKGMTYMMRNLAPTYILTLATQGEKAADDMLLQLELAEEKRSIGEMPLAIQEVPEGQQANSTNLNTLQAPPVSSEFNTMINLVYDILENFGIQLKRISQETSKKVGIAEIEESALLEHIQSIQQGNVDAYKKISKLTMNMIVNSISEKDKTPLGIVFKVKSDDGAVEESVNGTWGDLVKELKENTYFVEAEERSGVNPSLNLRKDILKKNISLLGEIGDVETAKLLIEQLIELDGLNLKELRAKAPQQAPAPEGGPPPAPGLDLGGQLSPQA